jgi:hypothetical protein
MGDVKLRYEVLDLPQEESRAFLVAVIGAPGRGIGDYALKDTPHFEGGFTGVTRF